MRPFSPTGILIVAFVFRAEFLIAFNVYIVDIAVTDIAVGLTNMPVSSPDVSISPLLYVRTSPSLKRKRNASVAHLGTDLGALPIVPL
ncbi:hypothetical protein BV898_16576 [Hypsibius exemplaris]|uniref:Uncharacterized protein n=1 Tax=Hypsibius exemplaris TaxID=2072580 RepID=A0A9X6RLE6_HYPEX|nr:hypothetical protein BV898_16576 [Hypsibius exemplaris]